MRFFMRRQGWVRLVYSNSQVIRRHGHQFQSLIVPIVCFNVLACSPEFNSHTVGGQPTSADKVSGEVSNRKTLSHGVELVGKDPHRYSAVVSWPVGFENIVISLNKKQIFSTQDKNLNKYEIGLHDNTEYVFRIEGQRENDQQLVLVDEWSVKTPKDFVLIESEVKANFDKTSELNIQAHRVFIPHTEGGETTFITSGRPVIINADELISDDGVISTFPKDQIAPANTHGRDGGLITIKATQAKGNLSFVLRGEDGGDGLNGENYTDQAAKGVDGTAADYTFRCTGQNEQVCTCDPRTADRENGKPGLKGAPARNGTDGGRGGNSGYIKIEVAEKSTGFNLDIFNQVAGKAGVPGRAGQPQKGGLGGKPWSPPTSPWITYVCKRRSMGRDGEDGDLGHDGVQQPNGKIEANCISIGEGFGRCS